MLLSEPTIYSLLLLQDGGYQKRRSSIGLAIPLLFWHSAVQSTDIASLHIYPCICSVAPCLRVLWMSTHGCFYPSFPLFPSIWLPQPDIGAQDPDATIDDDYYYSGGAYTYVQPTDDDHE